MAIFQPSKPVEVPAPSPFSLAILRGMQHGKNVYAGTVPAQTIARRRAANRVARASRRTNRRRGA